MSQSKNVAFIGLGNMGEPMVANLAKAGFNLKLHDVDSNRAAQLAEEYGATACLTWTDLAAGSELVITMLPTGAIVRDVLLEAEGGLLAQLTPGTLVVDMSSSEPLGSRELGETLAKRGVELIDAPVSGGVPGALAGTLSIMAGARQPSIIDRAMPVFEALGKRVFRTGGLGSGHAMKALNNYVAAAAYTATAEAVLIGERFGLDAAMMVEIINCSTGRSFNSEVVFAGQVVPGTFQTGFALGLLAKDVGIATGLGEALDVNAPVSRAVRERWEHARTILGATTDQSRALTAWGKK